MRSECWHLSSIRASVTGPANNVRPLDIKKLLDDDHETDDLDADMTVADVFVDNGLSQKDSRDQRGTVRVIQKPTPHAPTRFPSVSLDWDAAAQDYVRQVQIKKEGTASSVRKFPPIPEEDSQGESVAGSQSSASHQDGSRLRTPTSYNEDRRHDTPVKSVEKGDEIPGSPSRWREESGVNEEDSPDHNQGIVAATPQHNRMESQELGDSPTPTRPSTLRTYGRTSSSRPRTAASEKNSAANRTTTTYSELKSPPPAQKEDTNNLLPGRQKTRSQTQHLSEQASQVNIDHEKEEAREKEQDEDGDVVMEDGYVAAKEEQPPLNIDDVADAKAAEKDTRNGDTPETRLRKRKNNQEDMQSNKEPRLEKVGTPTASKECDVLIAREAEARKTSPCSLRTRRSIPSFCELGNRSNLLHSVSPCKTGIGLGITKSPGYKKLAKLNSAQDSSNKGEPSSSQAVASAMDTPAFSSSDPCVRRSSVKPNNPIPSNIENSVGKAKPLHSALRKNSPAKPSKRSVSFSESDKVIPEFGPNSKSTPPTAGKKPQNAPSGNKQPRLAGMNFPAMPQEALAKIVGEVAEEDRRRDEYERKVKEAEEQNVDPEHLRVLREMYETYSLILKYIRGNSTKAAVEQISWLQSRMGELEKELGGFEAKVKFPSKQPEKQDTLEPTEQRQSTPPSAKGFAKKTETTPKEATPKQRTSAPEPPRTKSSTKKTNPNGRESMPKEITLAPAPELSSRSGGPAKQAKERGHGGASEQASPKQATPKQLTPPQATPAPAPSSSMKSPAKRAKVGDYESTPKQATPKQPTPEKHIPTPAVAKETKKDSVPPAEELMNGDLAPATQDCADNGPGETAPRLQKKFDQSSPTKKAQKKQQASLSSARTRRATQMISKAMGGAENSSEPESQPEPEAQQQGSQPDSELESLLRAHSATCHQQPQEPQQPQSQQSLSQEWGESQPSQQPQPELPQELEQSQKEPPQSSIMSNNGRLPENHITRSVVEPKDPNEPATGPEPKLSSPKQSESESSSSESETESESEDSDDEDEDQRPGSTNHHQQPNGTSSARNSMTKSPAPPQSQPLPQNRFSSPFYWSQNPSQSQLQTRTIGFQPINRPMPPTRNGVSNLKAMLNNQKEEHDARLRQAREASTQKDVFEPPSNSESEDESDSDSDSNSDDENHSSANDGGTMGNMRRAVRKN